MTFSDLVERYRRELFAHCYRMLGSIDEAEDLVQETFLRAWRGWSDFAGRSSVRTWLYRIATNACLDALARAERRVLPSDLGPAVDADVQRPPADGIAWLQPIPDAMLDPDTAAVARETIELAFLAAVQHLPPRQRAALILRDVAGWTAREVAELLSISVPAANSAVQRARATMRSRLPERSDWTAGAADPAERELVKRYLAAVERADIAALAALLHADAVASMPPYPMWYRGRDTIVRTLTAGMTEDSPHFVGRFRPVATAANRQPAVALYRCPPGERVFRPFALNVLRVAGGRIAEITTFVDAGLFARFGLPESR